MHRSWLSCSPCCYCYCHCDWSNENNIAETMTKNENDWHWFHAQCTTQDPFWFRCRSHFCVFLVRAPSINTATGVCVVWAFLLNLTRLTIDEHFDVTWIDFEFGTIVGLFPFNLYDKMEIKFFIIDHFCSERFLFKEIIYMCKLQPKTTTDAPYPVHTHERHRRRREKKNNNKPHA